jgi:hypothetical protein
MGYHERVFAEARPMNTRRLTHALLGIALGFGFATATYAGACHGTACRDLYFDQDKEGCLIVRSRAQHNMEITVYSTHGNIQLRLYPGDSEKVYYIARKCLPAVDYIRAEAKLDNDGF